MIKNVCRYMAGYVVTASAVMMLVVLLQYHKYQIFGTTLMLGYDSPLYVWWAKDVITEGPLNMVRFWNYPHLYVQLLAFFGYLTGNVVVVERILPLLFGALLIYANSKLVLGVAKNVRIAGLAAFLTAISLNVLKIVSDSHRNLMAFSLSFIVLLLVADLNDDEPFLNKRYLSLIPVLVVIASTHFETFFVLSICLAIYGCLIKNPKKLLMLGVACAIPLAILISSFPVYFLEYVGVTSYTPELTLNEIVQWTGGSLAIFGFSIAGAIYLFYKTMQRNDKVTPLVFSWFLAIILVIILIQLTRVFPSLFSLRTLLIAPVPVLLALSISACDHFIKRIRLKQGRSSARYSTPLYVRLSLFFLALCLIGGSALLVFQSSDYFLTPYISRSSYEKIIATRNFFVKNGLSKPVVVFRGDPPIRFVELHRNYLRMELGKHFAYYGDIENLLLLAPSEPRIKYDAYLSQRERYLLTAYYNELLEGVKSVETLMSYPILIITPDFYKGEIPCYVKPFHIGEGIYIIPPSCNQYT